MPPTLEQWDRCQHYWATNWNDTVQPPLWEVMYGNRVFEMVSEHERRDGSTRVVVKTEDPRADNTQLSILFATRLRQHADDITKASSWAWDRKHGPRAHFWEDKTTGERVRLVCGRHYILTFDELSVTPTHFRFSTDDEWIEAPQKEGDKVVFDNEVAFETVERDPHMPIRMKLESSKRLIVLPFHMYGMAGQ
jgi:hypothetical protein